MPNKANAEKTYNLLIYFFENKIKVHFKDMNNHFYNAKIITLNKEYMNMVIVENYRGTMALSLEDINPTSIVAYVPKEDIEK